MLVSHVSLNVLLFVSLRFASHCVSCGDPNISVFLHSSFKTIMPSTGKPNLAPKCSSCINKHAKTTDIKHFQKNLMV